MNEGQQRSAQGLVGALVDHLAGHVGILAADFADSVEDDDRVVDRIADDRQERGHDRQVDLERLDHQEAQVGGDVDAHGDAAEP